MTDTRLLTGAAGHIQTLIDTPTTPRAIALVAHPHPLLGGHAQHKVPFTLARTLNRCGVATWRPNFRGVGASQGTHDRGDGETDDLLAVLDHMQQTHPDLPVVLAGFSFGAHVISRVAARCQAAGRGYLDVVLCGMPHGEIQGHRHYDSPILPQALVVHGELDDNVPLAQAFAWGAQAALPVAVVPATDHFFTGKLNQLSSLVSDRITLKLAP
ncbi:alpha/beta hydrolase [Pseudomonas sp. TE3610]